MCLDRYSMRQKPKNPETCDACNGIFALLETACQKAAAQAREQGIEFETFRIASTVNDECGGADAAMLRKLGYEKITPIKNAINREAGIFARKITGKEIDACDPEAVLKLNFKTGKFYFQKENAFIFGRYEKLEEGLSQTKWLCSWCNGAGCNNCGMRGTRFEDSVHQQIEAGFKKFGIAGSKLHGSGREDVDVRNIGGGRPFVIELESPKKRKLDLKYAQGQINSKGKVRIRDFQIVSPAMVEVIKNSRFDKNYHATVSCDGKPPIAYAKKIEALSGKMIYQQTPTRVLKRRADKTRERKIFKASAKIKKGKIECDIFAECGTYIKELISSDEGRTKPSVSGLIGKKAFCENLIMTGVEDDYLYCVLTPRKWRS